ncbi:hypothetical protein PIB30_068872 [Stylosanthes scabra]|uniref:Flavin-containing monooxygenase n=1 Tax=Stylosanthes scabra TaxID=79078 RepID=A0ABU6XLH2_9FABA|nr:hypothetical protein [Stylosanthes scabra]
MHMIVGKEFCQSLMPYPPSAPTFLSKPYFLQYIDKYVKCFEISPRYCRMVESAEYDEGKKVWRIEAKRRVQEECVEKTVVEVYRAKYVVKATGENSEGYISNVVGLETFNGQILHSKYFKNGSIFTKGYYKYVLNEDGMPKNEFPKHWKGDNGLYCAGLARRG